LIRSAHGHLTKHRWNRAIAIVGLAQGLYTVINLLIRELRALDHSPIPRLNSQRNKKSEWDSWKLFN